jgi:hypothetical protein
MNTNNSKPRRVDFGLYDEDFECAYLGSIGRTTKSIMLRTRLGPGQVNYRLKKAAIRRMDFRNGTSDVAMIVERALRGPITKNLEKHLKEM